MAFIQELTSIASGISNSQESRFAVDLSTIRAKRAGNVDVEMEVTGGDVVIKFGYDANVEADTTITSTAVVGTGGSLAVEQYHCTAGTVKVNTIPSVVSYVSIKGMTADVAKVRINFGFETTKGR